MTNDATPSSLHPLLPEYDFDYELKGWKFTGSPIVTRCYFPGDQSSTAALQGAYPKAGDVGSSCFAMAIDLETSNGLEISGLNAEEQSDISLIARYSGTQKAGFVYDVFTYIDSMLVLKENNVMELIQ